MLLLLFSFSFAQYREYKEGNRTGRGIQIKFWPFFSHLQNEIRKNFRKKHKRLYPINYAANEVFALRMVWVSCAGGPLASSEVRCDVSRRNKTDGEGWWKKWYLKGSRSDKLPASLCPVFFLQTSQIAWWSWKIKKTKQKQNTHSVVILKGTS